MEEPTHTQVPPASTSTSSPLKPTGYSPHHQHGQRRPPPTLPPPSIRRQKNLTQTLALLKHQREEKVREGRGGEDEIVRVIIAAERKRRVGEMEEEARRVGGIDPDGDFEMDMQEVMEMEKQIQQLGAGRMDLETRTCPGCLSDEVVVVDGGSVCFDCGAVEGVVSV
ncbi:hypothetical protein YB2330_002998 [Saitoella coloradoensis]